MIVKAILCGPRACTWRGRRSDQIAAAESGPLPPDPKGKYRQISQSTFQAKADRQSDVELPLEWRMTCTGF